MKAIDYLKTLPAYYINVDTNSERHQQFLSQTAPLFASVNRHPASPIVDARSEALEWREMIKLSKETPGHYDKVNVFLANDKTMEREKKQREYAATFSLYRSVLEVMNRFLESGEDRMILLEDDAVPRLQLLEEVNAASPFVDLIVWGGAIPMGAHNHDGKQFVAGKEPRWKEVTKKGTGRYIATAYEVTRYGAEVQAWALTAHPHAVDCAWWYTMDLVRSVVLEPTGFVQRGQSERISKLREGITER